MTSPRRPSLGPVFGYRDYQDTYANQSVLIRGSTSSKKQTCYIFVTEIDGPFKRRYKGEIRPGGSRDSNDFDYTSHVQLEGLPLDTKFKCVTCVIEAGDKIPTFETVKDWQASHFETRNKNDSITSFVFGSCCHAPIIGLNNSDDAPFQTIYKQWKSGYANDDFLLMLGDQIYGDHKLGGGILGNFDAPRWALKTPRHYFSHYLRAFRRRYKRRVMSSVPTYMIFDDHEVHNDWGSNNFLTNAEDYEILKSGLHAYNTYQVSHPDIKIADVDSIEYGKKLPKAKYYYDYAHGKSGFFVMDTRYTKVSLNHSKSNPNDVQMISQEQMKALKKFLTSKKHRVKFVASSVPLWPDSNKKNINIITRAFDHNPKERWEGYPDQRQEILDYIVEKGIKNVFFLSGDVHVSYASNLFNANTKQLVARQITSSAFNWGVGLNDSNFAKSKPLIGSEGRYKPKNLTGDVINEDNFCRLVVKTNKVEMKFHHAKTGKILGDSIFDIDL